MLSHFPLSMEKHPDPSLPSLAAVPSSGTGCQRVKGVATGEPCELRLNTSPTYCWMQGPYFPTSTQRKPAICFYFPLP